MKTTNSVLIFGILLAGMLMTRTISNEPRGIRNNNPGNIRKTGDKWQGLALRQTDSAFFVFSSPVYGLRALAKLLTNYQKRYELNTVRELINRWAPPIENDTSSYVRHVAEVVGVGPDDYINVNDHMPGLVKAIVTHENGKQPYSDELIFKAVSMV